MMSQTILTKIIDPGGEAIIAKPADKKNFYAEIRNQSKELIYKGFFQTHSKAITTCRNKFNEIRK